MCIGGVESLVRLVLVLVGPSSSSSSSSSSNMASTSRGGSGCACVSSYELRNDSGVVVGVVVDHW